MTGGALTTPPAPVAVAADGVDAAAAPVVGGGGGGGGGGSGAAGVPGPPWRPERRVDANVDGVGVAGVVAAVPGWSFLLATRRLPRLVLRSNRKYRVYHHHHHHH